MNTDTYLMRASLGDPAAFAELFDRHARTVHRYAASRTDRQAADDLLSETFLVAFEQRSRFDPERGEPLVWLLGIATTLIRKRRRLEARAYRGLEAATTLKLLGSDAMADADARLDAAAAVRDVIARLEKLSPGDRDVVLLFAWEELGYEQIAQALSIPLGTVRSRLNRARRKLGAALPHLLSSAASSDGSGPNDKEAGHGFAGTLA